MRHGNKVNHLGRTYSHRKAMLSNMGASLLVHKRIETTLAKAKELRVFIEPLINRGKEDSTHNRREVFSRLQDKAAVTELFNNISGKIAGRNGGYTRILKLGDNRAGDNAEMCLIELVDYNENMLKTAKAGTKKRSRRGSGKGVEKKETTTTAKTKKEETPEIEAPEIETPETESTEAAEE